MDNQQFRLPSIQEANSGCPSARAVPTNALCATRPLCGILSHDITVNGGTPFARRFANAVTISPNTVWGCSENFMYLWMKVFMRSEKTWVCRICENGQICRVKFTSGGIQEVSTLSDCQRNNSDCRATKVLDDGLWITHRKKVDHTTSHLKSKFVYKF